MADYPVKDGNADNVITYEKDPAYEATPYDNSDDYPVLDGNGAVVIASSLQWRHAATRTRPPIDANASFTGAMYRTIHQAAVDITSLKGVFPNWRFATANPAGSLSIRVGIEYPLGATPVRMYFGGAETGVIAPGENLVSDAVVVSIPAGAEFAVRTWYDNKVSGLIFANYCSSSKCIRMDIKNGVDAVDHTLTTSVAGSAQSAGYMPIALLAPHSSPAVMILGDSRIVGSGDLASTPDLGWAARSLAAGGVPHANLAKAGTAVTISASTVNWIDQFAALSVYFTQVLCNYGTNDIASGKSAAQILSALETLSAGVGLPFVQTTIAHRTSSTDGWATTVNQTQISNPSVVNSLNTTLLAGVDWAVKAVDVNAEACPTGVWNPGWTADGIHPNETGHIGITNMIDADDILYPSVYGMNLFDNGAYSSDSLWAKSAEVNIAGGVANLISATGSYTYFMQAVPVSAGATYEVDIEITAYTSGQIRVQGTGVGVSIADIPGSVGRHTALVTGLGDGTAYLYFARKNGVTNISFDNARIREVL